MRQVEFDTIRKNAFEISKGVWVVLKSLLDSLSDEELLKIPHISPEAKKVAEMYGICDSVLTKDGWVDIYFISPHIMKGDAHESKFD